MKLKFLLILCFIWSFTNFSQADDVGNDVSFYVGTFDVIDKEGDDKSSLVGLEHKNPDLFKDTFLGWIGSNKNFTKFYPRILSQR